METKTRVLIVDDHPFIREGLRFYLRDQPQFEVVGEAGDGAEAVQKGIELQPDIVIMDLRLPVFDGLEATRRLRHALPAVQVLVLSTQTGRECLPRALEAGAAGWVDKESSPFQLIRALETVSHAKAAA